MITNFGKNRRKRDWHKFGASYGHRKWVFFSLVCVFQLDDVYKVKAVFITVLDRTTQISWQPALSVLPSYQINISILTTMELSLQKRVCKFVFTTQGFKVTWLRYKYFQCTLKTLTILHFFQVVPNFLSLTETSRCLLSLVLVLGVFSNLTCATEEEDEKGKQNKLCIKDFEGEC